MADQTERAFQKQPTIFANKKGGLKPSESRFFCNPGLGFKIPNEAKSGNYVDKKCPFTGKVSIRGRVLTGVITKMKMNRTVVIRRDYLHYIKKYNRCTKKFLNAVAVIVYHQVREEAQEHVCAFVSLLQGRDGWRCGHRRRVQVIEMNRLSLHHIILSFVFRPLSKTVKFNTLKVSKGAASKKSFTKF